MKQVTYTLADMIDETNDLITIHAGVAVDIIAWDTEPDGKSVISVKVNGHDVTARVPSKYLVTMPGSLNTAGI